MTSRWHRTRRWAAGLHEQLRLRAGHLQLPGELHRAMSRGRHLLVRQRQAVRGAGPGTVGRPHPARDRRSAVPRTSISSWPTRSGPMPPRCASPSRRRSSTRSMRTARPAALRVPARSRLQADQGRGPLPARGPMPSRPAVTSSGAAGVAYIEGHEGALDDRGGDIVRLAGAALGQRQLLDRRRRRRTSEPGRTRSRS